MDTDVGRLTCDMDAEFRSAVDWWFRLRECSSDHRTLRDFSTWLAECTAHRKAFAQLEVLWQTVQRALPEPPAINPAPEPSASHPAGEEST